MAVKNHASNLVAGVETLKASGWHILLIRLGDGIDMLVCTAAFIFEAVMRPAL